MSILAEYLVGFPPNVCDETVSMDPMILAPETQVDQIPLVESRHELDGAAVEGTQLETETALEEGYEYLQVLNDPVRPSAPKRVTI